MVDGYRVFYGGGLGVKGSWLMVCSVVGREIRWLVNGFRDL